jgi:hypothetical protein
MLFSVTRQASSHLGTWLQIDGEDYFIGAKRIKVKSRHAAFILIKFNRIKSRLFQYIIYLKMYKITRASIAF